MLWVRRPFSSSDSCSVDSGFEKKRNRLSVSVSHRIRNRNTHYITFILYDHIRVVHVRRARTTSAKHKYVQTYECVMRYADAGCRCNVFRSYFRCHALSLSLSEHDQYEHNNPRKKTKQIESVCFRIPFRPISSTNKEHSVDVAIRASVCPCSCIIYAQNTTENHISSARSSMLSISFDYTAFWMR